MELLRNMQKVGNWRERAACVTWITSLQLLLVVCSCGRSSSVSVSESRSEVTTSPSPNTFRFDDVTLESGISFTYQNDASAGHFSILETLGGGVALMDFDLDGQLDVAVTGGGKYGEHHHIQGLAPAIYRGIGNLQFKDVTGSAGCALAPHYSHGFAVGDYNEDGWPDVLVTGFGGVLLFQNLGDGTFDEVSRLAGLVDESWSTGAAWGDIDNDGGLDLYLVHYVSWSWENNPECQGFATQLRDVCSPRRFDGLPDTLFRNQGDGTFIDASKETGMRTDGKGLGVLIADVDQDRDLDVYVANDTSENFLYENQGNGLFKDVGIIASTAFDERGIPNGSMGVDLGDFNRDGQFDIWVANFEAESFALYRNLGALSFLHASTASGISQLGGLYVGWGTAFVDIDCDGDEDLVCSTGHVVRHPINAPVRQRPLMLENRAGKFANRANEAGVYMFSDHEGRGLAVGDIDNDGKIDVVISHINEPITLLRNVTATNDHWIGLKLIGSHGCRDAIGTTVRIRLADRLLAKQVRGGGSYLSASDARLHFGVGPTAGPLTVIIDWPSGKHQITENLAVDKIHVIVEPLPD